MKKNIYLNISIAVVFLLSGILIGKYLSAENVNNENVSGTMTRPGSNVCTYCNFAVQATYQLLNAYNLEPTPVNVARVFDEVLTFDPLLPAALNDKKHLIVSLIVQGKTATEICDELYDCSAQN